MASLIAVSMITGALVSGFVATHNPYLAGSAVFCALMAIHIAIKEGLDR